MTSPAKYDDLDYRPDHGMIEMRGHAERWAIPVTVKQGRAMEDDGIVVMWPYASCPAWAVDMGIARLWMTAQRVFRWPSRLGR